MRTRFANAAQHADAFFVIRAISSTGRPNPEEVPVMSARSVGRYKGHLTVLIKELDKIVKDKNFSKGHDCIKLLAQLRKP